MPTPPSLTLAPHSRLRMDLRLGRLGGLRTALAEDPGLFDHTVVVSGEKTPRRVGDLLLSDAVLSGRPPANLPVVVYLLSQKAATAQTAPELLSMAVSLADQPVVDRLVAAGWSQDLRAPDTLSALEQAASQANAPLLRQWKQALPGSRDSQGRTLFHHLCMADLWNGGPEAAVETAKVLISGQVDWQQEDNTGRRAADFCRSPSVVEAIDQAWRRQQSAQRRRDLGKLANDPVVELTPRGRRM